MSTMPRWKAALDNALKKDPESTVFQLATVHDGEPRVRSHVFRAFVADGEGDNKAGTPLLMSTTDVRSAKVAQIVCMPRVELAWWFAGTQEQFRIGGRARVLGPECVAWQGKRREVFDRLGGHMRASWSRPVPGSPLAEDAREWPEKLPALGKARTERERRSVEEAFGNFALVVIEPDEVDFVELGVIPNRRTRFMLGAGIWEETALVP